MGHPDGQDYAVWRGPISDSGTKTVVAGNNYQNTTNVTNFASVLLSFQNVSNGLLVFLDLYADKAQSIHLGQKKWQLTGGTALYCIAPAAGNFAVVTVSSASGASTQFDIVIMPTNTAAGNTKYVNADNVRQVNNASIPANTTNSFTVPFVEEGTGILNVAPNDATGKLTFDVQELDASGNLIALLVHVALPTGAVNGVAFNAGPNPLKLTISNSDAASAHSCYATCRILSE